MVRIGPDVALTVSDREAAAKFYVEVMGFTRMRENEDWIHIKNGEANWYLCQDKDESPMFCFSTDDVPGTVERVVKAGGRVLSTNATETHVQDAFGVNYCIES